MDDWTRMNVPPRTVAWTFWGVLLTIVVVLVLLSNCDAAKAPSPTPTGSVSPR